MPRQIDQRGAIQQLIKRHNRFGLIFQTDDSHDPITTAGQRPPDVNWLEHATNKKPLGSCRGVCVSRERK